MSIPPFNFSSFGWCEDCQQYESFDNCTSASNGRCNCCACRNIPITGGQVWQGRSI